MTTKTKSTAKKSASKESTKPVARKKTPVKLKRPTIPRKIYMEIDDALAPSVTGDRICLLHEAATFVVMAKFDISYERMFLYDEINCYVDHREDIYDAIIELLSNPACAGCTPDQAAAFAAMAKKHREHVHDFLRMSVNYDLYED